MNQNEKIKFITDLFEKNVHSVSSIKIRSEHQKKMFCLLVDNRSVSVLINESFINEFQNKEIEEHFNDINIYRLIESKDKSGPISKDDILIFPDDPVCQKLHSRQ